jgi:hypothetical protein
MALKFNDIFARRGSRRIESQDQRTVEKRARSRIAQVADRGLAGVRQRTGDQPSSLLRARATHTNNRDRSRRATARQCENRVQSALR